VAFKLLKPQAFADYRSTTVPKSFDAFLTGGCKKIVPPSFAWDWGCCEAARLFKTFEMS
jgi:hypothetical protein